MTYKVISGSSIEDLEKEVNDYLQENWALQGGVCIGTNDCGFREYCQAMTKK